MKFNDMPYERPSIDEFRAQCNALTEQLKNASSFAEADALFLKLDKLFSIITSKASIVYVRHTINTEDEFYDKENDFCDEMQPVITEIMQNTSLVLFESKFRGDFEAKYGKILFTNIELELKAFKPEIIPEMQEENKLVSEYDKLIASAQIPFNGGTYTLSQLSPFKQSKDDTERLAAWKADGGFFTDNGAQLDEIYDKLVKVRTSMAKKLGYKNFVELGYYRMTRNCYTAEDVAKFREAIKKYIVPIADILYRQQAKRTNLPYPLSFSDAVLSFRSGNPKPFGSPDEILAHAKTLYHELSPETAEFIDFMYDNELLDVLSRKGKVGGGYCISFPEFDSQFIFANFNGTQHDVEVVTHEAGHAFAGYMSTKAGVPFTLASPSLESCEIHSMSMEFFAWPWEHGFFGDDTDKFYFSHLAGAITFLPYGTMVDHFQHIVYENPEMTPAERHATWKELLATYMPWLAVDGKIPFYADGKAWQRQSHIYQVPFYYIDYCLAQTVALEFWTAMQHDTKDAWERYLRLVKLAGTRTFDELVSAAGLDTPFGDGALSKVAQEASAWLDKCDQSKLK